MNIKSNNLYLRVILLLIFTLYMAEGVLKHCFHAMLIILQLVCSIIVEVGVIVKLSRLQCPLQGALMLPCSETLMGIHSTRILMSLPPPELHSLSTTWPILIRIGAIYGCPTLAGASSHLPVLFHLFALWSLYHYAW